MRYESSVSMSDDFIPVFKVYNYSCGYGVQIIGHKIAVEYAKYLSLEFNRMFYVAFYGVSCKNPISPARAWEKLSKRQVEVDKANIDYAIKDLEERYGV